MAVSPPVHTVIHPVAPPFCVSVFAVDFPAHFGHNRPKPKWRNWQTRRIQNPVGLTPGEGSIPSFGTLWLWPLRGSSVGMKLEAGE